MKCRAMQALHLLALEPIAETTADPNSYGFRPERSTADAAAQCFGALSRRANAEWVSHGAIDPHGRQRPAGALLGRSRDYAADN